MKPWSLILILMANCAVIGQHPFYTHLFDDGRAAMELEDWERAGKYLEVAAFGLLDREDLLVDIYVRLVIVFDRMQDSERKDDFELRARRIFGDQLIKPATLSHELWQHYLVIAGRQPPSAAALPSDPDQLEAITRSDPQRQDAWLALVDALALRASRSKLRKTLKAALLKHPHDRALLSRALVFAATRDGDRGANDFAGRLLALDDDHPLAHEYFGGEAMARGEVAAAREHFRRAGEPQLPRTFEYLQVLERASLKEESAREAQSAASEMEKPRTEGISGGDVAEDQDATPPDLALAGENARPGGAEPQISPAALDPPSLEPPSEDADPDSVLGRIDSFLDKGDLVQAKHELIRLGPQDGTRYAEVYGHYSYLRGDFENNVAHLTKIADPSDRIRLYLGLSYFELGRTDLAAATLAGLDPDRFPELKAMGVRVNFEGSESAADADADAEATAVQDPAAFEGDAFARVDSLLAGQHWTAAAQTLDTLAEPQRSSDESQYFRARLDLQGGRFSQALASFVDLARGRYQKREIFYFAGLAASRSGDYSLAGYFFDRAIDQGTAFTDEIRRMQTACLSPRPLFASKKVKKALQSLAKRPFPTSDGASLLALLRLASVSGLEHEFPGPRRKLDDWQLGSQQQILVDAWFAVNRGDLKLAAKRVGDGQSDEALFLRAYLARWGGDGEAVEHFLGRVREPAAFPELSLLRKP